MGREERISFGGAQKGNETCTTMRRALVHVHCEDSHVSLSRRAAAMEIMVMDSRHVIPCCRRLSWSWSGGRRGCLVFGVWC